MYLIFTLQEVYHAAKQCSDSDCRGDAVIGRPSSNVHRWPIHLGHKFRYMYMYAKVYSWDKLIVLYGFCRAHSIWLDTIIIILWAFTLS